MGKTVYVCEYCGVTDIEILVWQNPNTGEVTGDYDEGHRQCFCNNCGEESHFVMIDENELVNIAMFEEK